MPLNDLQLNPEFKTLDPWTVKDLENADMNNPIRHENERQILEQLRQKQFKKEQEELCQKQQIEQKKGRKN